MRNRLLAAVALVALLAVGFAPVPAAVADGPVIAVPVTFNAIPFLPFNVYARSEAGTWSMIGSGGVPVSGEVSATYTTTSTPTAVRVGLAGGLWLALDDVGPDGGWVL